jgi:hypothetical protein
MQDSARAPMWRAADKDHYSPNTNALPFNGRDTPGKAALR